MVLFSEMFVSELKNIPVVDRLQEPIGTAKDIILTVGEVFPKITGLLVKLNDHKEAVMLMGEIDMIGKQFVSTKTVKDRIVFARPTKNELLLRQDILDKQIVDTAGVRVIRVNDLKLGKIGQDIRLLAADVGLKGLLRRLRCLPFFTFVFGLFKKEIPDILIGWDHIESFKTGRVTGELTIPKKHLSDLHPSDIAHIISQVHAEEKQAIFTSLSDKTAAELLHELEPKIQAMLLLTVDTKKALGILEKMPVDEAADVLGDLLPEKVDEFLRLIRPRKSLEIRKLLNHAEETAGGLMTTEFIAIPDNLTAEQTINLLRERAPGAETIYYLFVINNDEKLVGILSLRNLIIAQPATPIADIMIKDLITVGAEAGQRKVADIISKYNLLAVPVVDAANKLLGIITVDDVIDFIIPPISRKKRQMVG